MTLLLPEIIFNMTISLFLVTYFDCAIETKPTPCDVADCVVLWIALFHNFDKRRPLRKTRTPAKILGSFPFTAATKSPCLLLFFLAAVFAFTWFAVLIIGDLSCTVGGTLHTDNVEPLPVEAAAAAAVAEKAELVWGGGDEKRVVVLAVIPGAKTSSTH